MENLSAELLVKIFSDFIESEGCVPFLRNVTPVCKHWKDLSLTPSLWRVVKEKRWYNLLNLSRRGYLYHTQNLKIPLKFDNPVDLSEVIPNIRKLKALEMSCGKVNENMLMLVTRHCQDLERLVMINVRYDFGNGSTSLTLDDLLPVLNVCGHKLKHLDLSLNYMSKTDQLLEGIIEKCPSLENFGFNNLIETSSIENPFPVRKILNGCSRLKKLEFSGVHVATSGMRNCTGLENLKVFTAFENCFHGLDLYDLLKNANDLEHLELETNENLLIENVSKIPTNKLKSLTITPRDCDRELQYLEQAVEKWKHTLLELNLWGWESDVSSVFQILLKDNPNLKLQSLSVEVGITNHPIFRTFINECKTLSRMNVSSPWPYGNTEFINRQEVETMPDLLQQQTRRYNKR